MSQGKRNEMREKISPSPRFVTPEEQDRASELEIAFRVFNDCKTKSDNPAFDPLIESQLQSMPSQGWTPPDNVFKILLLGEGRSDKSGIVYEYVNGTRNGFCNPIIIGVQLYFKEIFLEKIPYLLHIWDLSDTDRFRFMMPYYTIGAKGAILFGGDCDEEWVQIARTFNKEMPILYINPHFDQKSVQDVAKLLNLFNSIDVSLPTMENWVDPFNLIARKILGLSFPDEDVRLALEKAREVEEKARKEREDYDTRIATYNARLAARHITPIESSQVIQERVAEEARRERERKDEEARFDAIALAEYNKRFYVTTSVTIPSPIHTVYDNLLEKLDVILRMSQLSASIEKIGHPDPKTTVVYDTSGKVIYELKLRSQVSPQFCEFHYTSFPGDPSHTEQFVLKFHFTTQNQGTTELLVSEECLKWNINRRNNWKQNPFQIPSLKMHIIPALYIWRQTLPKKDTADRDRDLKVVLGMVKCRKQIQLARTAEKLGMSREKVEELIAELLGGNVVEGEFLDADTFRITSDVGAAIKALEATFASWKRNPSGKVD